VLVALDQPPPKEPRGPVSLRIKFRSASLDQFIERYGVDVSRGGIFIRTREPLAVGTQLKFDFQLQDAAALLAGEGTVVWIRENDPTRAGVTPGMGVRFDKLTPASQPVLEKILAEKLRRDQAGGAAKAGPASGLPVRRPSSTFSALDPAAARATTTPGRAPAGAQARAAAPTTGTGPLGSQPQATAPATGTGPLGSQPQAAAPATGSGPVSSTARTAERPVPAGILTLEGAGAFGRPRATTGMNAQRPAPTPHAIFEKPTADDIDRALSVLTEVDGGGVPTPAPPVDFSARIRRPTDAQPLVLESSADVGDGAPRRANTGTRPLFSSPDLNVSDPRRSTVPVIPIGDSPDENVEDVEEDVKEDGEEDATSAWIGSGPTRAGGTDEAVAMAEAARLAPVVPPTPVAPPPSVPPPGAPTPPAPTLSLDGPLPTAAAPAIMTPALARPAPKKRSGTPLFILVLLLAAGAGAGGYYYLKGGFKPASPPVPAPTPVAESPPTVTPAVDAQAAAPAAETAAPADGGAAPVAAAEPERPLPVPPVEHNATPSSLRARPAGEAPPPEEAKPAEAEVKAKEEPKPEAKPEHAHRGKRRAAANAEAEPAVADVSPKPPGDAPAPPTADAPVKDSGRAIIKISSAPEGAEVIIDGNSVGKTPYSGNDLDPGLPHSITLKKEGFEDHEHMIGSSDWPRAHNGARTLKINAKLRSTGGGEAAKPADTTAPSELTPGLGTTPASPKRE
jgi:uncharacterized protein (TIGR02266 family)